MKNCAIIALVVLTLRAGVAGPPLMLGDIHPEGSAFPDQLTPCVGSVFFVADDGMGGRELWVTNGEPEGTKLILDIRPGVEDSTIRAMLPFGQDLLFVAEDGVHGEELWRANLNEAILVKDISDGPGGSDIGLDEGDDEVSPQFLTIEDMVYFVAEDGEHGAELWKSDGTEEGTVLLHDFVPGPDAHDIDDLTEFQGDLYCTLKHQSLYKCNEGIGDCERIEETFVPQDLITELEPIGDKLLVSILFGGIGGALALYDGKRFDHVIDLIPNLSAGEAGTVPEMLTEFAGRVYFRLAIFEVESGEAYETGDETWVSDGTREGTSMIWHNFRNFYGMYSGYLFLIASGNLLRIDEAGELQFVERFVSRGGVAPIGETLIMRGITGDPLTSAELWKVNADSLMITLVKDIREGEAESEPDSIMALGGVALFTANDGIHGRELWQSDGTETGTRLVMDINPGPADSNIQHMTVFNDMLIFSADDGVHGQELWVYKPDPSASVESEVWLDYMGWETGRED